MKNFKTLSNFYLQQLLTDTLPFWEKHSLDKKYGGYFTCLDRKGQVYDTDKFMWLQGRQIWTFAMLYNRLEKRESWLRIAESGVKFILKNGRDIKGNWYFSFDRQGKPLMQPYNIFSDCFACIGLAQYSLATGSKTAEKIALETFF
ncbi:MAG: AGE family epimerase/isomerase, partial [Candidatus Firestonebacteria bacterium]